jgi:hypothetical protein
MQLGRKRRTPSGKYHPGGVNIRTTGRAGDGVETMTKSIWKYKLRDHVISMESNRIGVVVDRFVCFEQPWYVVQFDRRLKGFREWIRTQFGDVTHMSEYNNLWDIEEPILRPAKPGKA